MKLLLLRFGLLGFAAAFVIDASAADKPVERSPFEGTWQWKFKMPDGGEVTPQVKLSRKDGKFNGISRFRLGADAPLANIKLTGEQISFEVIRERNGQRVVSRYRGAISNDTLKGTVTFKSDGPEQTFPWEAKKQSSIEGLWKWVLPGRRPVESKMTLELQGETITGVVTSPAPLAARTANPAAGSGALTVDSEIQNGLFKGGNISFHTERVGTDGNNYTNSYAGKLAGDNIFGKVIMTGSRGVTTNDWNVIRGN